MTADQERAAQPEAAKAARPEVAALAEFAEERPGDPACLLRRVCQACGAVAETDPPTVCPQCGAELPGS